MASDVLSGEEVAVLERLRDLSDHSVNLDRHQIAPDEPHKPQRTGSDRDQSQKATPPCCPSIPHRRVLQPRHRSKIDAATSC